MLKIAAIYGAVSGTIIIGVMTIGFSMSDGSIPDNAQAVGYLIMLVALSLIFVGIKRYRDQEKGGVIKFMPAFLTGLAIAAVAGVFYVIGWEIYLAVSNNPFYEAYGQGLIEARKAEGLTGEALEAEIRKIEATMARLENPLFRMPVTFTEIFPVGLIVALVSAAILRNPKVLPARAAP